MGLAAPLRQEFSTEYIYDGCLVRTQAGHRTCVIDFDIGLRNMDLHLGCERRVIFDFVNVIQVRALCACTKYYPAVDVVVTL